jgi:fatty acid desaturase
MIALRRIAPFRERTHSTATSRERRSIVACWLVAAVFAAVAAWRAFVAACWDRTIGTAKQTATTTQTAVNGTRRKCRISGRPAPP